MGSQRTGMDTAASIFEGLLPGSCSLQHWRYSSGRRGRSHGRYTCSFMVGATFHRILRFQACVIPHQPETVIFDGQVVLKHPLSQRLAGVLWQRTSHMQARCVYRYLFFRQDPARMQQRRQRQRRPTSESPASPAPRLEAQAQFDYPNCPAHAPCATTADATAATTEATAAATQGAHLGLQLPAHCPPEASVPHNATDVTSGKVRLLLLIPRPRHQRFAWLSCLAVLVGCVGWPCWSF